MIRKIQYSLMRLMVMTSILTMLSIHTKAQISFTATALTKSENFNGMTALVLPTGITANAATSVGTSASSLSSSSGGNSYKFISGTDFAIGFLNSGSFTTGKTIVAQYVNNTGSVITQLDIAFDYEKYRSGSRAWEFIFATGTNGTAYTTVASGGHSFAADAGNTVASFPPLVTSKTLTITGLNIANGGSYYLRWTLSGNGGSSNGQALGIDNLVVTATIAGNSCGVPTSLVKRSIKDTSATISWTRPATGSFSGYEYEISTSATPPTSGTALTDTFATASPLTPSTKYYIHLRTDCGSSTFSDWVKDSFTTAEPCVVPLIDTEPAGKIICKGSSPLLFVQATGSSPAFKWQVNAGSGFTDLANNASYQGVNNDTLQFINADTSLNSLLYRCIVTNMCGADTSAEVSLVVNLSYAINNPQTICNGGSYTFNGHTYTTAGNHNDTLQTVNGCDSIIVTQLTVNPVYSVNNPQTICGGSYTFNGNTYSIPGTYNDTLQSVNGCDSIIVTQLTINPVYSVNNPRTICTGGSYTFNGNTYTTAGNYNDTLQTVNGCDSIIITQLTVNPTYSVNNPQTICNGGSYTFNGHTYTTAGNHNDTLQTVNGCDSIIITQLTVNPTYSVNNPQTICNGGSYTFNGHTYTTAGNHNDTLQTVNGCDSIIVTQLTVNPTYSVNNPQTICNGGSYTFNGHTYTTAGNHNDTLQTVNGCDSIIVTQLTVNPVYSVNNPQAICNGGSYTFNGHTYTTAGNHNDTLQTVNGCDSIIVTQLTVNPVYSVNNPRTICNGGSYTFNGHTYTTAGNHNDTLQTVNGCDSIIVTQLTVNPTYSVNNPQTICNGGSYTFNGHTYTTAGNHNDTLQSVTGCDSIIVTQLTVNPVYSVNNPQTICNGGSYSFNGHTYTTAGNHNDTLQSITGCDSIIVTVLTVNAKPSTSVISGNTNTTPNASESYSVVLTSGSTYNWIISNGVQTSGTNTNSIVVKWNNNTLPGSVKVVETNTNGCKGDTVTTNVMLPVEFIRFTATQDNNNINLAWATASEKSNKGFYVERLAGNTWKTVDFVPGKGYSNAVNNYVYTDRNAVPVAQNNTLYYRLKQVDFNGKSEYSKVVLVNTQEKAKPAVKFTVAPNPVTDNSTIAYELTEAAAINLAIYNVLGQPVKTLVNLQQAKGSYQLAFPELVNGVYYVQLSINGQARTVKVIVK